MIFLDRCLENAHLCIDFSARRNLYIDMNIVEINDSQ